MIRPETKVTAATFGAAAAGLIVWVLDSYVFVGDTPDPVELFVWVFVTGLVTFGAGYLAKHTPRTDPAATQPPPPDDRI